MTAAKASNNVRSMDTRDVDDYSTLATQPDPDTYASVAEFVRSSDTRYLRCREGRHFYPQVRIQDMRFKRDGLGYDIFDITCEVCHEAYQRKTYLIKENDAGEILSIKFLGNKTHYVRPEGGGRNPYLLPPGSGYYSPTDIHEARVETALVGRKVKRVGPRAVS